MSVIFVWAILPAIIIFAWLYLSRKVVVKINGEENSRRIMRFFGSLFVAFLCYLALTLIGAVPILLIMKFCV